MRTRGHGPESLAAEGNSVWESKVVVYVGKLLGHAHLIEVQRSVVTLKGATATATAKKQKMCTVINS